MNALALMVLLGLAGAPLAFRLAGPRAEAIPLAPLLGAGYLAAGASLEVAVGGPPIGDAVTALVAGALLPMIGPISRAVQGRQVHRPVVRRQEVVLLLVPSLLLFWALSALKRTEIGWDGRSIWFFHARMLMGGQDVFLARAQSFPFSHPDYPLLASSVLSLGWGVGGSIDYRTGQLAIAALTACATVLAGFAVARALVVPSWLAPIIAAVCVGLCYGVWDTSGSNGDVDPLMAALILAAAVYGLLAAPGVLQARLALALVVLASAVKNEGLVFGLIILVLIAARQLLGRYQKPSIPAEVRPGWFITAFGLMLLWPLVARSQGLVSDITGASLLHGQAADPVYRIGVVLKALGPRLSLTMAGFVGLAVMGLLGPRDARWRVGGFLTAELGAAFALLAAYAVGPNEIQWWLRTSLDRTDMVLRAGGLLAAVYAVALAGGVLVHEYLRVDNANTEPSP